MRLAAAIAPLGLALVHRAPGAVAQTCPGVSGPFTLADLTGTCDYDALLAAYARQVFGAKGALAASCLASDASGVAPLTAKDDFDGKLTAATNATTGEAAGALLCRALYDGADVTPFTRAADKGDDLQFEQMFYNGLSDWQDEVETLAEGYAEGDAPVRSSYLKEDAVKVREFYDGEGQYSRVAWPDALTNFAPATCASHAAMCCWPKDRQANDNNGNCATNTYDENCVDKDPADNTNLCFADLQKGNASSGFASDSGFAVFPGDNDDGEGAIHCHGLAWADDDYEHTARYKANNLFFVSMYDHMYQRGYVKNIPGMPMCGCLDQMPLVTRSDCTQVDLTEDWEVSYDGAAFAMRMTKVEVEFNSCRGRNNRNNDLWAYAARLYDEGRMTHQQFGRVGRALTDDHDCHHGVQKAKHDKGYVTGYLHDEALWTPVAGRDALFRGEPIGRHAFDKALAGSVTPEHPIVHRICPHCVETHQNIYYRRLTDAPAGFDVLHDILRHNSNNPATGNVWNVDFTLHSTYDDAKAGTDPWTCPNDSFAYNHAFYGECSPDGTRVQNQHSNWWWFPGPQPDVAYFVNKPQDEGLQDYIDPLSDRGTGETDVDIGNVGRAGNTLEKDGVYHITGAGSNIGSGADSFHYLSQPWGGDVDVRVRVSEFTNNGNSGGAKAGLMLRADDSPDATYVFIMQKYGDGVYFQHRRSKGKSAENSANKWSFDDSDGATTWLRLFKKMEQIQFFTAMDDAGEDWTLRGTVAILFPDDQYRVGLAIGSAKTDYLAEATFDGYEIQAYEFPSAAPSVSSAPTAYDPVYEIATQRAGSYAQSGDGLETFQGSGSDLWGTRDSFYFHGSQWVAARDFTGGMHIVKFDNYQLHSRGGLMLRDSLAPDAANAFVGAAGYDQGAVFQSRAATGAQTAHHQMIWANNVNQFYVRLAKAGAVVTASFKVHEADAWTVLGSAELAFTGDVIYVGRAVTAGRDYQNALETLQTRDYAIIDQSEDAPSAAPSLTGTPTVLAPKNVITGSAVASQDSVCYGGSASRAIDGDRDGNWGHNSVMHTCDASTPWWKVDLGTDVRIAKVSVYNRSDCCWDRLGSSELQILDADGNILESRPFEGDQLEYHFTFDNVAGRSVRLYKNEQGVLNIAEVEVLGY